MSEYKSHPYTVPVNHKALQHTRIKELQVRMMKWQDRFTFTLRCQKRAGKLTKGELEQLNHYWKIYEQR